MMMNIAPPRPGSSERITMSKARLKEADLAKDVIAWLVDQKWDVYQEVEFWSGSAVADIVSVQGPVLWIIECKTSASLAVIEQAMRWIGHPNLISVAVPKSSQTFRSICRKFGIGMLTTRNGIYETVPPKLLRRSTAGLRDKLTPEHKTFAVAGNANSRRWTPFQSTCLEVLRAVHLNPGICMKDLVSKCNTHYSTPSTARICLSRWIKKGIVPGVRMERDGRFLKIYPM